MIAPVHIPEGQPMRIALATGAHSGVMVTDDMHRDLATFPHEKAAAILLAHDALVVLARAVAEHFADTDAPLGIAARAALQSVES